MKLLISLLLLIFSIQFASAQSIVSAEYFFDSDPGIGNANPLNFNPNDTILINDFIPLNSLNSGFHNLVIRFKDSSGKWSHNESRQFYISRYPNNQALFISAAEYFFDNDPGVGNANHININAVDSVLLNTTIPLNGLNKGFHKLVFRFQDSSGKWSHNESRIFYTASQTANSNIDYAEYFFDDTDPGIGNGNAIIGFTTNDTVTINALISSSGLNSGTHKITIRTRTQDGIWSHNETRSFNVCNGIAVANYTYNVSGNTVNISANNSTDAFSYLWVWGDGTTSISATPSHTYSANGGQFEFCLVAQSACGSDTSCNLINFACSPPIASFTNTLNGQSVTLNNTSSGATSYYWSFGDGNDYTGNTPPSYTYASSGNFNICLSATNSCGTNNYCSNININNCTAPDAQFYASLTGTSAKFYNNSINASSVLWKFGDGTTSTQFSPTHNYPNAGGYTPILYAYNNCGVDSFSYTLYVNCAKPKPDYLFYTDGLNVEFENNTTGASSYKWNFNDGSPLSSLKNPIHLFPSTGTYNVCLKGTNACGTDSICYDVTVCAPPTANFTAQATGLTIQFTNTSLNGVTYLWDMGDGFATNIKNPSHTFANADSFEVCLAAYNQCGQNSFCKWVKTSCSEITKQEVCQATVEKDFANRYEIYWEKPQTTSIDSFVVYRLTGLNQYSRVGALHYNMPSVLTDMQVLAGTQPQSYKVSLIDTCGIESPLSDIEHTTVHYVIDFTANNEPRIIFNKYYGRDVFSYQIMRSVTGIPGLVNIDVVPASALTNYQWVDLNAPSADSVWYRVETVWLDTTSCNPDRARIATSRSNVRNVNTRLTKLNQKLMDKLVNVYPNPANNTLNISLEYNMREKITLRLFDMQGKLVMEQNEEARGYFQTQLNISDLSIGAYQLQIQTEGGLINKKIIKQ